MEEEKTLTLKSLEKQVREQFAELGKMIEENKNKIDIIEKSLRR